MQRIIELDEVKIDGKTYYKARGCNTLFLDEHGLKNITKPYLKPIVRTQRLDCIGSLSKCDAFTLGKTYVFENNTVVDDNGRLYESYEDFRELFVNYNFGKRDETLLNCDFVITKTCSREFSVGKVYSVVNGKFKSDKGNVLPYCGAIASFGELVDYFDKDTKNSKKFSNFYTTEIVKVVKE